MEFNDNATLDPSQMSNPIGGGGGGRGGGLAIGGGLGLVITIIALLLGRPDLVGMGGDSTPQQTQSSSTSGCTRGSDIKSNRECRWVADINSIQAYWSQALPGYTKVPTQPFTGQIQTGCGNASSEVGPFYCSADKKVYIDTGFADQLLQQLGAQGGDAAEAYILAHEYGHHVQDETGTLAKVQRAGNQTGPTSPGVRLELQADCYAGVWFANATKQQNGPVAQITPDDLLRVSDAASAVGDDRIQQQSSGRVNPESWTHGSAKARHHWVTTGFTSGNPNSCDTFSTNNLEG